MGQSTDAILVYGIDFGEEPPWPEFEEPEEEFDEEAARLLNPIGYAAFTGEAIEGISIVRHCSESCPMYILAIAGSEVRAWRGSPKALTTPLKTGPAWDAVFAKFLGTHGIKTESKPGWLLASDWG